MRSTRFWIITTAVVFLAACGVAVLINIIPTEGGAAEIYRDGELVQTVDLTSVVAPYTITLEQGGKVNIIEIERGRIRMLEAGCPDLSCVRQGWISTGVAPVVCLPHGIVIKIIGVAPDGLDAVAG